MWAFIEIPKSCSICPFTLWSGYAFHVYWDHLQICFILYFRLLQVISPLHTAFFLFICISSRKCLWCFSWFLLPFMHAFILSHNCLAIYKITLSIFVIWTQGFCREKNNRKKSYIWKFEFIKANWGCHQMHSSISYLHFLTV